MRDEKVRLERGKAIRIRSTIKKGMSDDEFYFETKIRGIRNQLIHGFAPREYIHLAKGVGDFPLEGDVTVAILGFLGKENEIVRLLFPGEILAPSNPVSVERKEIIAGIPK